MVVSKGGHRCWVKNYQGEETRGKGRKAIPCFLFKKGFYLLKAGGRAATVVVNDRQGGRDTTDARTKEGEGVCAAHSAFAGIQESPDRAGLGEGAGRFRRRMTGGKGARTTHRQANSWAEFELKGWHPSNGFKWFSKDYLAKGGFIVYTEGGGG